MPDIMPVSSRSLNDRLQLIVKKFQTDLVSNQAYLVNGTQVVWVGPEKKIFFGAEGTEASGATMEAAAKAAGIL
jgi:hypothetical protein